MLDILAKGKGFIAWIKVPPVEAVTMTPQEWENGDSIITDFGRRGEILYAT